MDSLGGSVLGAFWKLCVRMAGVSSPSTARPCAAPSTGRRPGARFMSSPPLTPRRNWFWDRQPSVRASHKTSAPTGPSRTACAGCSTWHSTRTVQERERITPPKTSPSSESSHSRSSRQQGRHLDSTQTKSIRMVRRIRKNRHRPNATALAASATFLDKGRV